MAGVTVYDSVLEGHVRLGGPWLSDRVLASGPVGPGIDTPPGHG